MTFDPYLPADCQGSDPTFPWNHADHPEDLQSLGSDCCSDVVKHIDGVIICCECGEPCEEVFETEDQFDQRMKQQAEDAAEEAAILKFENSYTFED